MPKKAWEVLAYAAMVVMALISAVIAAKWAVNFVEWTRLDSGWAQTIGALIGLGIAVWLPHKQRVDDAAGDRQHRADQKRRVCMAFRDELTLLQNNFTMPNIVEMLRDAPGEIYDREVPILLARFPIFETMIGRLSEIDQDNVRHRLIDAYEHANAVIAVMSMNNVRLVRFVELRRQALAMGDAGNIHDDELKFMFENMAHIRTQLHEMTKKTISRVDKVVLLLNELIDSHSA